MKKQGFRKVGRAGSARRGRLGEPSLPSATRSGPVTLCSVLLLSSLMAAAWPAAAPAQGKLDAFESDYDVAALLTWRNVSLKAGYRWVASPHESLAGPYAGLSLRL